MKKGENFLLVDGLNLCFKNHSNQSKMISDIKKGLKIFRKFMGDKVQNLILVYGLLPPNNDLAQRYHELVYKLNLKQQEYKSVPFYNLFKKGILEKEIKDISQEIEGLKAKVLCKDKDFWKHFIDILRKELVNEGYILNKIIPIPINLYRKHSSYSKIEKEDDIVLAVFMGLLAVMSNKFMIFSDDRRLIEVSFKALEFYNILSRKIGAIVRSEKMSVSLQKEFGNKATIVVLDKVIPPSIENLGDNPW